MTTTSLSQIQTLKAYAFDVSVHARSNHARTQFWTVPELAQAKGVSDADILYFVNKGLITSNKSQVTNVLYLAQDADSIFDKLFFGNLISINEPEKNKTIDQEKRVKSQTTPSEKIASVTQKKAVEIQTSPLETSVSITQDKTVEVHTPLITNELLLFLQTFSSSPKVLPSMTGMSIKASRKKKMIQLREHKADQYFQLIAYPIEHQFSNEDIKTLQKAWDRFRSRIISKKPWKDKNFLLNGSYREILTFHELFEFHKEGQTKDHARSIHRIQNRFFSGVWGEKLIANYCIESFRTDYLDRLVVSRQDSDRNEIIKMVNAAISKAKAAINIQIDVQELIKRGERSRADKSDKVIPQMSTLAQFIAESYELGYDRLGLKLIMQFMTSTRENRTNCMEWKRIKLNKQFVEVPAPESKKGFRRHPIPERLEEILTYEKNEQRRNKKLTTDRSNEPVWVFESPYNKGKVDSTLNTQFDEVRKSLYNLAQVQGASKKDLKAIKSFTQHRIRDIVEQELLYVNASERQKEKCLGRLPDERSESYGNLSIEKLCELKDKMVTKAELEFPELKSLFQHLCGQSKGVMLKYSGVKKGVKNSSEKLETLTA